MKSKPATEGAEQTLQHLPAILAAAAISQSTLITHRGREIAAVVPAAAARFSKPLPLTALAGSAWGVWGARSSQTICWCATNGNVRRCGGPAARRAPVEIA